MTIDLEKACRVADEMLAVEEKLENEGTHTSDEQRICHVLVTGAAQITQLCTAIVSMAQNAQKDGK